jgi:hypothetical protein
MAIETKTKTECAHPACGCMKETGSEHCGQSCKDAGALAEIACKCGHPGCSVHAG